MGGDGGHEFGNYRTVGSLGEGGMGVVFEAVHVYMGRRAAVKSLHPELSDNPRFAARFLNEARALSRLRHPGIVEVFDFGVRADGIAYLVMELLDGNRLDEHRRRAGGRLGPEALELARQIALALHAAHEEGIVHRDLKPHNVMVMDGAAGPRMKLFDFGIAKLDDAGEAAAGGVPAWRTRTGVRMGTPEYMAPEQCDESGSVGAPGDVYSLGVTLYELLAGRLPFSAALAIDTMALQLRAQPPHLGELAPWLPPELVALVHRMLAKHAAERPSMAEVARRLEALQPAAIAAWAALPAAARESFVGSDGAELPPAVTPVADATLRTTPGEEEPPAPPPVRAPTAHAPAPTASFGPRARRAAFIALAALVTVLAVSRSLRRGGPERASPTARSPDDRRTRRTPSFTKGAGFVTGLHPSLMATGDFDGDGNADLVTSNWDGGSITLLRGNGRGAFKAGEFMTGKQPAAVVAARFGGHLGVAVANRADGTISVLAGKGQGALAVPITFAAGPTPNGLSAADLDRNGFVDLLVANAESGRLGVLLATGAAAWKPAVEYAVGDNPDFTLAHDLDGDGALDVIVVNRDSQTVSLLRGLGDGRLGAARAIAVGHQPIWATPADLDGDGRVDLAVSLYGDDAVAILPGNGDGTFRAVTRAPAGSTPAGMVCADLDGDGVLDLAVANYLSPTASVLGGRGDGTFDPPLTLSVGQHPLSIVTNDFDGDQRPDLAVANFSTSSVTVFLNVTPGLAP